MLIGIMSDSHDNVPMIEKAVEYFNLQDCDLVLHAGDVVAPFSIAVLRKLECPWQAIYGNNDGEKVGLKLKAAALGGAIQEPPLTVAADGRKIVVLHDCEDGIAAAEEFGADVLIFGHTHQVLLEMPEGKGSSPLAINPGECGGWLSGKCSVALLETRDLDVRIIDLEKGRDLVIDI